MLVQKRGVLRIIIFIKYCVEEIMSLSVFLEVLLKLMLSLILGGIVGYEREHKSRPAGLRTHILVCVGAALVQVTSINFNGSRCAVNFDPMRLGAQVISGIGFLGAGTIIKEGASIKGLTTAASLWVVACIGLAVGSGLYMEGTLATFLILFSLEGFNKMEERISRGKKCLFLEIISENTPGRLGDICSELGKLNTQIISVEINKNEGYTANIEIVIRPNSDIRDEDIVDGIMNIKGIKEVKVSG